MRKEPFVVGSFVHIYNRGNRKQPIVQDAKDKWHFLQMLYYFNDEFSPANPFRELRELLKSDFNSRLTWPKEWPPHKPLVKILAFALMESHFHLLIKEIREKGTAKFMQKLGTGMTNYFNTKYQETGRLFQGAYKAKLVDEDRYLRYVSVYIQVKNPFELYSGGLQKAIEEFDEAFEWTIQYPYCSLADYAGRRNSPIIDRDLLRVLFPDSEEYKKFARECLSSMNLNEKMGALTLDE